MQYTLAQVRSLTWQYAQNVPLATATTSELASYLAMLNICTERLLTLGKWRGTRQRVDLPVYDNHLTLPRYLEACLGVNQANCCLSPRQIYGMFSPFQMALNETWTNGVTCVSETAQTFIVPDAGFKLKVVSFSASDNTKKIKFINGTDSSGDPIYATEELTFNVGTPPTSTTTWNTLPIIQKEATTSGIELYSVIGSTEELIAIYAPSEIVPAYKRYRINNSNQLTSVDALCKLAYVPAVADTDLIFPSVIGAILKGLQAVKYELASDDRDADRWAAAYKILQDDRVELDGKNIIIIETAGEFGGGSTPNLTGDYWGWPGYMGTGCGSC